MTIEELRKRIDEADEESSIPYPVLTDGKKIYEINGYVTYSNNVSIRYRNANYHNAWVGTKLYFNLHPIKELPQQLMLLNSLCTVELARVNTDEYVYKRCFNNKQIQTDIKDKHAKIIITI